MTCSKTYHFLLARFLAPWRYGIPNLAKFAKNSENWLKRPTGNNLTKGATDTWDLGPNICTMSILEAASTQLSP